MSDFFPHVDLTSLKKFALNAVTAENSAIIYSRKLQGSTPQVTGCEDVIWAGEKMILINFNKASLPLGPDSVLAHFPSGRYRLTTQALIGMTQVVRAPPGEINAPRVYAYRDYLPNDINAEVVLLEKVPGDCLETVWPTLTSFEEMKVCVKLTELLLKLFNCRGSLICTDLQGTEMNNRGASKRPSTQFRSPKPTHAHPSVLQSRPFTEGPLSSMDPQKALSSTTDYLLALSQRIDRIFTSSSATESARASTHPMDPPLTDVNILRIRETWQRLGSLIPYHTGGFYIPGTLSSEARHLAYEVLQSNEFGIYHSDMQMSRFIIQIIPGSAQSTPENPDLDVVLTLTGWEHAFRAPLWSCARFPRFLTPRPILHETISWERQATFRNLIFVLMNEQHMLPASWQWIVGYVYGVTERWFEGCLSCHWMYSDAIEIALERLKAYWMEQRPDIPFPLEVGTAFRNSRLCGSTAVETPEELWMEPLLTSANDNVNAMTAVVWGTAQNSTPDASLLDLEDATVALTF